MPWDAERVGSWLHALICAWREQRATADTGGPWYVDLSEPLQAEVVVVRSSTAPVEASCVVFRRDPQQDDLRIEVLIDPSGSSGSDDEDPVRGWIIEELREKVADATANWDLGARYLEEPIWKLLFCSRLLPDGPVPGRAWFVARPIEQLPTVSEFVSLPLGIAGSVSASATSPPPAPPTRVQHTRHIHENDREFEAFTRWVWHHSDELLAAMGVSGPGWLGLFLDRKDVFGESLQGDIDFLGGPLQPALSAEQWHELMKAEAVKWDASTPQRAIRSFAAELAAAKQIFYVWPPKLDTVVAGEIKVSWFDPAGQDMKARDARKLRARGEPVVPGKWHGVHRGKGVNAKTELQLLVDHGFERVAFFHLGTTDPQPSQANAWIQALAHADDAGQKQDPLFDPREMPGCGYFTAVVGAVPHKHEGLAGAGGSLCIEVDPKPNQTRATWKNHLLSELQKLPAPSALSVFVRACPNCKAWMSLPSPHARPCAACAGSGNAPTGPSTP